MAFILMGSFSFAISSEALKSPFSSSPFSRCTHWTFVSKWKVNCYLKSRLGEKAEFEGGVSGTFGQRCGENGGQLL